MICATLVNRQIYIERQPLTGYTISSTSWAKKWAVLLLRLRRHSSRQDASSDRQSEPADDEKVPTVSTTLQRKSGEHCNEPLVYAVYTLLLISAFRGLVLLTLKGMWHKSKMPILRAVGPTNSNDVLTVIIRVGFVKILLLLPCLTILFRLLLLLSFVRFLTSLSLPL